MKIVEIDVFKFAFRRGVSENAKSLPCDFGKKVKSNVIAQYALFGFGGKSGKTFKYWGDAVFIDRC